MLYTCNVQLINELFHYFMILLWVQISTDHILPVYHSDNANQSYQHTFEERMGTNQHESYIKLIFIIVFLFSEVPVIVMRVVVSHQLPT